MVQVRSAHAQFSVKRNVTIILHFAFSIVTRCYYDPTIAYFQYICNSIWLISGIVGFDLFWLIGCIADVYSFLLIILKEVTMKHVLFTLGAVGTMQSLQVINTKKVI